MSGPTGTNGNFQMSCYRFSGDLNALRGLFGPDNNQQQSEITREDVQDVFRQADISGKNGQGADGQLSKKELKRYVKLKEAELLTSQLNNPNGGGQDSQKTQKELAIAKGLLKNFDRYAGMMGDKKTINSEEANQFAQDQNGMTPFSPFSQGGSPFGGGGDNPMGMPFSFGGGGLPGEAGADPLSRFPLIDGLNGGANFPASGSNF